MDIHKYGYINTDMHKYCLSYARISHNSNGDSLVEKFHLVPSYLKIQTIMFLGLLVVWK